MQEKNFFAVDIGASSGRTILGTLRGGRLEIRDLTRFTNPLVEVAGHYYWDVLHLYGAILDGLRKVAEEGIEISSAGIDTWGVDFVAFDQNGEMLSMPYSYRDPQTVGAFEEFFKVIPREEVYMATGIQIMNFNTLFQFSTLKKNNASALKYADKLLFMPDALSYLLTGEAVMEYTIASTAQILNPQTRKPDAKLLGAVGLDESKFGRPVLPGTKTGMLSESVCRQTGIKSVPVVAVAGHDTASAVAAVPASDEKFAYLSSGTWSLMGIELQKPVVNEQTYKLNFTNEGGVDGTIRFLKNICGMWLLEQARKEWDPKLDYQTLIRDCSREEAFGFLINPDDPAFASPTKMTEAIADYCVSTGQGKPRNVAQFVRCIFESLALRYKQVFDMLRQVAPFEITKLHVIGGGSRNNLLNQFTANALGVNVVTGPSEATAIGNIMLQAKALGEVNTLTEIRRVVCESVTSDTFIPEEGEKWQAGYEKFLKIIK